ncbi:MAG: hypothetical protein ACRDJM_05760 [Actinomycetota bacterium]
MRFAESWKAEWEGDVLHISGVTDAFPNDFSTASLRHISTDSHIAAYIVVFHRDKEPFCGPDLVGPVHFFERALERGVKTIRIIAPGRTDHVDVPVPPSIQTH